MTPEARRLALRELAGGLDRIDVDVYDAYGKDPLEPVLGLGHPDCRVCFFGRDPGRHEVEHGEPFIGAGGQKVRRGLWRALRGGELPDFEASVAIGRHAYWANTVPYKPIGNKVWSAKVRKAFRPLVCDLLVHDWRGTDVLALGRVAFDWFGHDRDTRERLKAHWARDDAFASHVEVEIAAPDGATKTLRLHPLPHPSPLNATWAPHFPRILDERLSAVGLSGDRWRIDPSP